MLKVALLCRLTEVTKYKVGDKRMGKRMGHREERANIFPNFIQLLLNSLLLLEARELPFLAVSRFTLPAVKIQT